MVTFTYIISAVILLGLCIFIHELGHLLGGMMVGIKAKVFSMGYGKGFLKKKIGETTYQVTLIPFGGYCQFYGEEPGEEREGKDYEFLTAPPWKRILTVAMGPLFNLFFGIILFFIMNMVGYTKETNRIIIPDEFRAGSYISPAHKAGLQSGDRIIEIEGKKITGFTDIQSSIIFSKGKDLRIKVERSGQVKEFSVTPQSADTSNRYSIGVIPYGERVLIAGLIDGDVAEKAGLRQMDEIVSIDGTRITTPKEFTDYVKKRTGEKIRLKLVRGAATIELDIVPRANKVVSVDDVMVLDSASAQKAILKKGLSFNGVPVESYDALLGKVAESAGKKVVIEVNKNRLEGKGAVETRGFIGVYPVIAPEMVFYKYGALEGFVYAFVEPYEFIVMNLKGLGMLITGKMDVRENLSGPIRIAKIAGDVAYYKGISAFVILLAKISIILMVMNFLPIPVVDGGHLLFFVVEAIRGKPLNQKVMERIQTVGVIVLITLGVFVIINDISMLPIIQKLFNN